MKIYILMTVLLLAIVSVQSAPLEQPSNIGTLHKRGFFNWMQEQWDKMRGKTPKDSKKEEEPVMPSDDDNATADKTDDVDASEKKGKKHRLKHWWNKLRGKNHKKDDENESDSDSKQEIESDRKEKSLGDEEEPEGNADASLDEQIGDSLVEGEKPEVKGNDYPEEEEEGDYPEEQQGAYPEDEEQEGYEGEGFDKGPKSLDEGYEEDFEGFQGAAQPDRFQKGQGSFEEKDDEFFDTEDDFPLEDHFKSDEYLPSGDKGFSEYF